MDLGLSGSSVLVTGSYRGTGLIMARAFLDEGAEVWVHGLEAGQAETAVAELGGGIPVTGDIRTEAGSAALIARLGVRPRYSSTIMAPPSAAAGWALTQTTGSAPIS
jgi:NAD(P)-dependent dehydrogenase (short-subunit alcohol dehydrogenase family)